MAGSLRLAKMQQEQVFHLMGKKVIELGFGHQGVLSRKFQRQNLLLLDHKEPGQIPSSSRSFLGGTLGRKSELQIKTVSWQIREQKYFLICDLYECLESCISQFA